MVSATNGYPLNFKDRTLAYAPRIAILAATRVYMDTRPAGTRRVHSGYPKYFPAFNSCLGGTTSGDMW